MLSFLIKTTVALKYNFQRLNCSLKKPKKILQQRLCNMSIHTLLLTPPTAKKTICRHQKIVSLNYGVCNQRKNGNQNCVSSTYFENKAHFRTNLAEGNLWVYAYGICTTCAHKLLLHADEPTQGSAIYDIAPIFDSPPFPCHHSHSSLPNTRRGIRLLIFWQFSSHYALISHPMFINFVPTFEAVSQLIARVWQNMEFWPRIIP